MKLRSRLLLTASVLEILAAASAAGAAPATSPFQWPSPPKAPAHAPNILLIMTDDVGFGASSAFGGPISTPTFDALAAEGLRYNNFHTTAICSATRAALLTGRNHHNVGMARVAEAPAPADGYTTVMPKTAATVAEILRENGYNTAMFGKSHNVPVWEESAAGPFDRWPTGQGFEYFYGFLNGDTNQFAPQLYDGTTPVEPPAHDPGYILDKDLADHAIQWIGDHDAVAPDKPFLIYYASGTAHAPHQAPADWLERYKGRFDEGWDALRAEILARQKKLGVVPASTKLSARPSMLPAWNSLSPERRKAYARMMEVYAAALSYDDYQIGRVVEALRREGQLQNTLIIYVQGDNGSSAEGAQQGLWNESTIINGVDEDFQMVQARLGAWGGPQAYAHFPAAWANAMSTPFPYFKRIASHLGAEGNGLVICWPERIHDGGQIRSQFHHVIDVTPTILEAAGVKAPAVVDGVAQKPLDGVSMVYTFDQANAPGRRPTQYFEMEGNRAIFHDGWWAGTTPDVMPWQLTNMPPFDPQKQRWELYDLTHDFGQSTDVAAQHPEKLRELQALFDQEARRYHVLPLSRGGISLPPQAVTKRDLYRYLLPATRIPAPAAPNLLNRSFEIDAKIDVPPNGAEGVLVTQGGRFGGYGLYLKDSTPVFAYNLLGLDTVQIKGANRIEPGRHDITVRFTYDGGGRGKGGTANLLVDGAEAAQGRIPRTIPVVISLSETFDVGSDTGTPVTDDYSVPFKFTGDLVELTVRPE